MPRYPARKRLWYYWLLICIPFHLAPIMVAHGRGEEDGAGYTAQLIGFGSGSKQDDPAGLVGEVIKVACRCLTARGAPLIWIPGVIGG